MACPDSGPIKISDLVAEFGGSAPHALSEYYRDGGEVPGNNTNVPTSGQISLTDFYSAVNEIQHIIDTNTNHFNAQSAFSSHWNTTVPKRVIINSGVTVGATSGNDAFHIPSGMAGTLVIDNNGNIHGHGGAGSSSGSGGSGGDAMQCDQSTGVTVNNNGQIYAGGGGGGKGGTGGSGGTGGQGGSGGNGSLSRIYTGPGRYSDYNGTLYNTNSCWFYAASHTYAVWGGYTNQCYDSGCDYYYWCYENVYTNGGSGGSGGGGGNGGAGGAGGNGQGHNQAQGNGSAGASGSGGSAGSAGANPGNNAGQGGTGGTGGTGGQGGTGGNGGTWGNSGGSGSTGNSGAGGNTGASGNNGNQSNGSGGSGGSSGSGGSGGSSGGSAGYYIRNRSYVTLNQNGSVAGQ